MTTYNEASTPVDGSSHLASELLRISSEDHQALLSTESQGYQHLRVNSSSMIGTHTRFFIYLGLASLTYFINNYQVKQWN